MTLEQANELAAQQGCVSFDTARLLHEAGFSIPETTSYHTSLYFGQQMQLAESWDTFDDYEMTCDYDTVYFAPNITQLLSALPQKLEIKGSVLYLRIKTRMFDGNLVWWGSYISEDGLAMRDAAAYNATVQDTLAYVWLTLLTLHKLPATK